MGASAWIPWRNTNRTAINLAVQTHRSTDNDCTCGYCRWRSGRCLRGIGNLCTPRCCRNRYSRHDLSSPKTEDRRRRTEGEFTL